MTFPLIDDKTIWYRSMQKPTPIFFDTNKIPEAVLLKDCLDTKANELLDLIESVLLQRMDEFRKEAENGAESKRALLDEFLVWIRKERVVNKEIKEKTKSQKENLQ